MQVPQKSRTKQQNWAFWWANSMRVYYSWCFCAPAQQVKVLLFSKVNINWSCDHASVTRGFTNSSQFVAWSKSCPWITVSMLFGSKIVSCSQEGTFWLITYGNSVLVWALPCLQCLVLPFHNLSKCRRCLPLRSGERYSAVSHHVRFGSCSSDL